MRSVFSFAADVPVARFDCSFKMSKRKRLAQVKVSYDSSDSEFSSAGEEDNEARVPIRSIVQKKDCDLSGDEIPQLIPLDDDKNGSGNAGWADAMSKVLGSTVKNKNFLLSKAKKDKDIDVTHQKTEEKTVEIIGADGQKIEADVPETPVSTPNSKKKSRQERLSSSARKNPKECNREKEVWLNQMATRGVVQLFNAVHQHHSSSSSKT